ncbi:Thioredoxin [Anaerosphaera aminiphila DSM 21120]|uniref:Thioredoxin n=1 Tax=Anaerosphaera aminiphila DSM 21120 TaxID=1120995 RepID=A0A1M5RVG0_9FIRM|nr:thioredoxin family protein [Anaerosphaera aminiphila]SHH30159.1 Thioredoxin [Anaerosphaera aminiphila DSM 21120]
MKVVENISENTLLFFKTNSCAICDSMIEKLFTELKDIDIDLKIVQIEEEPALKGKYLVFTAPTLLYLKNGNEIFRESGFFDFPKIIHILENELQLN